MVCEVVNMVGLEIVTVGSVTVPGRWAYAPAA
jgi:hypothetical protein